MSRRPHTCRRARRATRQQGAVMLIVLLMLLMATGSALYAMQATFYEQGASTAYGEASWTRSLAEGAAMSGLAVVEETGANGIPRGPGQELDIRWRNQGNPRAPFSIMYGVPTPLAGTTGAAATPDGSRSFDNTVDSNVLLANMQEGLAGFCLPTRNGQAPYGAPFAASNIRGSNCRVIYESWAVTGNNAAQNGNVVVPITRTVITGIGETAVPGDPLDSGNQRGLHQTVGMARAYFDRQ
jgi:hypothetical protein